MLHVYTMYFGKCLIYLLNFFSLKDFVEINGLLIMNYLFLLRTLPLDFYGRNTFYGPSALITVWQ
jgi:hypothetical protein